MTYAVLSQALAQVFDPYVLWVIFGSALFGLHLYTWSLILFGAVIAGKSGKRILGRAYHDRANRVAARCIPAADHPVGSAGQ